MIYGNDSEIQEKRNFDSFWAPDYRGSDIWQVQGFLHDRRNRYVDFAFRAELMRIGAGSKSFYEASVSLVDMMNKHEFTRRVTLPGRYVDSNVIYVDEDCILCGDLLQMMLFDGRDIALRLRLDSLGLDLRLNRRADEVWFGEEGLLPLAKNQRQYKCSLPQLAVSGRLYAGNSSIAVLGRASVQHFKGDMALHRDKKHWERFCIFMDNGDELNLTVLPRDGHGMAEVFPTQVASYVPERFTLNHTAEEQRGAYTFSFAWEINIPSYYDGILRLELLPYPQLFELPVPRPLIAVYDEQGRRIGYAFGELLPGARSSTAIDLKMFL